MDRIQKKKRQNKAHLSANHIHGLKLKTHILQSSENKIEVTTDEITSHLSTKFHVILFWEANGVLEKFTCRWVR